MAEMSISGFSGMNNIKRDENFFSAEGIAEPRIILNADVNISSGLLARRGVTKILSLSRGHSLWSGVSCSLVVDSGILYRFTPPVKTAIGNIDDRDYPLAYAEIDSKVYFSNPYCKGVYDAVGNTLLEWGVSTPVSPLLLTGEGSLPPGEYSVVMTNSSGGEISGTGILSKITLSTTGGIQVLNRPSGADVWCTDENEGIFYRVGKVNKITALNNVEPCLSLFCSPPPCMTNLCSAFGRIWGSVDNVVYYSQPFKYGWFKLSVNKFEFESEVTLIAKVNTGLFIGTRNKTKFLHGVEPEKMIQIDAGAGSVAGTLAYCNNVPELGDILGTPEKGYVDVPIWVTSEGVVIGNVTGRLYNLTKNKLMFGIPERGASLYRTYDGTFQYLTSFKSGGDGSTAGFSDSATCEVFRNGELVTI